MEESLTVWSYLQMDRKKSIVPKNKSTFITIFGQMQISISPQIIIHFQEKN